MIRIAQLLNRRLTFRQAVMVVVVTAAFGGAGYAGYRLVSARVLQRQVNAAFPLVCAAVREQRSAVIRAIEDYRTHFGFYPPDNIVTRQPLVVNAVTNSLLYEIAGVSYNPQKQVFEVGGLEPAGATYVKRFLHTTGFVNCVSSPGQAKRFFALDNLPVRMVHDDPDVFVVGFQVSQVKIPVDVTWEIQASSWRYVSSAPEHNPGKFDLWIEVTTKARRQVIGNWKQVE